LSSTSSTNNGSTDISSDSDLNKQLSHLQVKLEDLEYKFERLIERLEALERK